MESEGLGNDKPAVPVDGDGEESVVGKVEAPATGVVGEETTTPGSGGEEDHEDGDLTETRGKLSPEVQKVLDRAIGKKVAKLRQAEERLAEAARERDALRQERDELKGRVSDDTVLAAAQQAGVLPDYVSAEDAKLVGEAEHGKAEVRNLRKLVLSGEEYTGVNQAGREQTWSRAELVYLLEQAEDRLERIGGRAAAIKAKAVERLRADIERGRKGNVEKADGGKLKAETAKHTARKPMPPALPGEGGQRRDLNGGEAPSVDWSKVSSPEEMREALLKEERARSRTRK